MFVCIHAAATLIKIVQHPFKPLFAQCCNLASPTVCRLLAVEHLEYELWLIGSVSVGGVCGLLSCDSVIG